MNWWKNIILYPKEDNVTRQINDIRLNVFEITGSTITYSQKRQIATNIMSTYSWQTFWNNPVYRQILSTPTNNYWKLVDSYLYPWKNSTKTTFTNCSWWTINWITYAWVSYSYWDILHNDMWTWTWQIIITNWSKNYSSNISCYDWEIIISDETENIICNNWVYVQPTCPSWYTYSSTYKQCVNYSIISLQNPTQCKVYVAINHVFLATDWWVHVHNLTTSPWWTVWGSRVSGHVFAWNQDIRSTFSFKFDNTCTIISYTKSTSVATLSLLPWQSTTYWDPISNNSTYSCPTGYSIYSWNCKSNEPYSYQSITCSSWDFDESLNLCKYKHCE